MLRKNRLVVKTAGRDFGLCVVLASRKKDNMLQVVGPGVRKRWVNPAHLEPLPEKIDTTKLADDELIEQLRVKEEEFKNAKLSFIQNESLKARLSR